MEPDANEIAGALRVAVGLLMRRMRQVRTEDGLTMPEISALARLDRGGPTTASALARVEQISPQSMGATLAALEARGVVGRRPDPGDGRRAVISVTDAGRRLLRTRRHAKTDHLARALEAEFTPAELGQLSASTPLIERLAQRI
ncbi:MAG TPA: MarR family transcriptional regulator [Streptosporangiaceae bacterium]|jgi:DNA-binding MarR family transcriptional regulator